jgi:limonene-1,2-epoxide hydrolase
MNVRTRREVLVASGLGLLATTILNTPARAKDAVLTEAEKDNVRLVKEFLASWNTPPLDIDKIVAQYFAPNASVRWTDDALPAIGVEAAAAAAKAGMPDGAVAQIEIYDIWTHGPLVATSRLDVIKIPGKPDTLFKTAGVAVVKNGKFVEYCDYVFT